MSFWTRLLHWLGMRPDPEPVTYEFAGEARLALTSLAGREGRSRQEVAADLVNSGLAHYSTDRDAWERWCRLSPREQDVAALACLGYANKQIALRLGISTETIKTHMSRVLAKFEQPSRALLAERLGDWDFSAWEEQKLQQG